MSNLKKASILDPEGRRTWKKPEAPKFAGKEIFGTVYLPFLAFPRVVRLGWWILNFNVGGEWWRATLASQKIYVGGWLGCIDIGSGWGVEFGKAHKDSVWLGGWDKNEEGETRLEVWSIEKDIWEKVIAISKEWSWGQVRIFRSLLFHLLKEELLGTNNYVKKWDNRGKEDK